MNLLTQNKIFNIVCYIILISSFFFSFPFTTLASHTNSYTVDFERNSLQYGSVNDTLDITSTTTVTMWFNMESEITGSALSIEQTLISKWNSSGQRSYWIGISKNNANTGSAVEVLTSNSSQTTLITEQNYTFNINTWYFLAVVFAPQTSTIKIYLGTQSSAPTLLKTDTTQNSDYKDSTTAFQVGGITNQNIYFDGKIDEIRWFDRELNSSEISDYYNCELNEEIGTQHHWGFENDMNDGSGSTNFTNNNSATFQSLSLPYINLCTAIEEPPTILSPLLTEPRFFDDISVVSGYIEHYTTSTTTPSEVQHVYYKISFIYWLIIFIPLLWMLYRLLIEFIIRLRH